MKENDFRNLTEIFRVTKFHKNNETKKKKKTTKKLNNLKPT